ncbi:hypothetical protein OAO87_04005 [bacterium]|nr:hypothetical protein [bacterium]
MRRDFSGREQAQAAIAADERRLADERVRQQQWEQSSAPAALEAQLPPPRPQAAVGQQQVGGWHVIDVLLD